MFDFKTLLHVAAASGAHEKVLMALLEMAGPSTAEMAAVLNKELETRLKSAKLQVDRLINAVELLQIAVGDRFKAASADAAGGAPKGRPALSAGKAAP